MTFIEHDPFDADDVARVETAKEQTTEQRVAQAQKVLRDRRDAYMRYFGGLGIDGDKRTVMGDLRRFCRGGETAWAADPREHALLTGRQEVYQRIVDHLELDFDDLWERYNRTPI